jgi:16S rRNA (cytosine967-C5)-methyltransferase
LVSGTIKWQRRLDWIIDRLSKRKKGPDPKTRNILRLALYQLTFLSGSPPYAVVSETVKLAKREIPGREGFINGILRTYLRTEPKSLLPNPETEPIIFLGVSHSLPDWLISSWLTDYGPLLTEKLCQQANEFSGTTFRVNCLQTNRNDFLELLASQENTSDAITTSGNITQTLYAPEGFTARKAGGLLSSHHFQQGTITVQDEGAQLISYLLHPAAGQIILDACAAPGGKAWHLAEISGDQATIIAADVSKKRTRLVANTGKRLHLRAVQPLVADLCRPLPPEIPQSFDSILVDAPCSGLGVLRRRADLRWRKQPGDPEQLATIQLQILKNCSTYLKKGGRMVYATCTTSKKENQGVIERFLAEQPDFSLLSPAQLTPSWIRPWFSGEGYLQTFFFKPGGLDGFFAAVLQRR